MDWLTIIQNTGLVTPVLGVLGIILSIFLNRAVGVFQTATGLEVEKAARDALHSAIMTGVETALTEGPEESLEYIKKRAVTYAKNSVPGAIRTLVPGDGVLDDLAVKYYRRALGFTPAQ